MTKEFFIEKLKELAPSIEDFQKYDLPEDFIKELVNKYICEIKKSKSVFFQKDILLDLLATYNLSRLEISTLVFLENPIEFENFYQIGNVDVEILAIDKITLQIVVLDHEDPEHIMWLCASNSNNFLEAILICIEFFSLKIKGLVNIDDLSVTLQYINKCEVKAGGDSYRKFYKFLLGYFD